MHVGRLARLSAAGGGGGCASLGRSALPQVRPLGIRNDFLVPFQLKRLVAESEGKRSEARAATDDSNSKNCIGHFYPQGATARLVNQASDPERSSETHSDTLGRQDKRKDIAIIFMHKLNRRA